MASIAGGITEAAHKVLTDAAIADVTLALVPAPDAGAADQLSESTFNVYVYPLAYEVNPGTRGADEHIITVGVAVMRRQGGTWAEAEALMLKVDAVRNALIRRNIQATDGKVGNYMDVSSATAIDPALLRENNIGASFMAFRYMILI
jgi:hypothetical protein